MSEIVVTVNDNTLLPLLEKAISLLRGVTKVSIKKEESQNQDACLTEELPENIKSLIGVASGISQQQIEADDRLKYLMEKYHS